VVSSNGIFLIHVELFNDAVDAIEGRHSELIELSLSERLHGHTANKHDMSGFNPRGTVRVGIEYGTSPMIGNYVMLIPRSAPATTSPVRSTDPCPCHKIRGLRCGKKCESTCGTRMCTDACNK
jgi:hypothetical protein